MPEFITLTINGETKRCALGQTLGGYLADAGMDRERIIAERNGAIVRSEDFDRHILQEGDTVEFVRFVGGG